MEVAISCEWKIYLATKINFMLSRDSNGKGLMHSKSGGEEVITGFHTEELIKELFHLLLHWYQVVLEQQMRGGEFVLDYVGRLFCKCYKISLNCDPKIDFPQWLKKRKPHQTPQNILLICALSIR